MTTGIEERPDRVPADAWWDAGDQEWVLGERDAVGRFQGEVRYWRADGTLAAFCAYVDGVPHGAAGRFHESGEPSQTLTYVEGTMHGTRTWTSIDGPTTENTRPPGVSDDVMRSEMDYDHGTVTAVRHYSAEGQRLNADGSAMPVAPPELPEGVWFDERDERWKLGEANEDGTLRGAWHVWRVDGSRYAERHYSDDGVLQWLREWHPDGSEAQHLDFVAAEGWYCSGPEATDCTTVALPDGAAKVTFGMRVVNPQTGLHWKVDQDYRTADGTRLTEGGQVVRQPHPDAVPVVRGSWSRSYRWHLREDTEGGRVDRFWHQDGSPAFTATFDGDTLVALETFGEDGTTVRERFRAGDDGPLHTGLVVQGTTGRVEVVYRPDGTMEAIVLDEGGSSVRRELSLEGVAAADFGEWFVERLGVLQAAGLRLEADHFDVRAAEVEVLDFYFKGVQLLANHGGDYAIVVTGGDKHRGKVFVNYHDEGVYMMHEEFDEDIRDHLEMEGIDPDAADHDTIVEHLPLFCNDLAPSLQELAGRFRASSSTFYTDEYAEYRPLS